MILNRAVGRDVEKVFRDKQGHECHHLQVGLERAELLPDFRLAIGLRLIDRQIGCERRVLQRVGLGTRLFRRRVDGDDIVAALKQRFEHRLAERLLAVNHDTHREFFLLPLMPVQEASSNKPSLPCWVPACAGTSGPSVYAASAFFSGALMAPDVLIASISRSGYFNTSRSTSSVCSPSSGERRTSAVE